MNRMSLGRQWALGLVFVLVWSGPTFAQVFSSGSTGALGPFAPAANTAVTLPADGVLNYSTVTIPAGVTVTFVNNAANTPVTLLATADVTIAGIIKLDGANGIPGSSSGPPVNPGSVGGPGSFNGGSGGSRDGLILPAAGQGPGGGVSGSSGGSLAASYGVPGGFVSLIPLIGGSGGGGGIKFDVFGQPQSGGSGGGGAGAIVIASSTRITVTGSVTANGGAPPACGAGIPTSGGGSGGAIRLVAPQVNGTGTLQAIGNGTSPSCSQAGGPGRIRLEAFTLGFSGPSTPLTLTSPSPGPVTAASNPALINLPMLTISSVGGIAVPSFPAGSYSTADVSLPAGTTSPVPVVLTATNTPLNTTFTVRLIPVAGNSTTFPVSAPSGTPSTFTVSADVTFPSGQVSVLNAFATLTITAGLFPLIDGEPVDHVMMAANYGSLSASTLVTKSGREVAIDQLSQEDQLKVAQAFEKIRQGGNGS